jgi:hypothetical protein
MNNSNTHKNRSPTSSKERKIMDGLFSYSNAKVALAESAATRLH